MDRDSGLITLARQLQLAGSHDDALELFRSEPDTWSFASLPWAADLAAGEGDIELLTRMAQVTLLSAGRLAELLITRHGVDHARHSLHDLLGNAVSGEYRHLRAPRWRLPLAAGLGRTGDPAQGQALIQEVLADAEDRERELAHEVLIDLFVDTGDVAGLQELHHSRVDAATNPYCKLLADLGEWKRLRHYADELSGAASKAVWALRCCGAQDQLEILAAEGNYLGQLYLADLLDERDDDEGLWHQLRSGNEAAARKVIDRLRRAEDVEALERLSAEGFADANEKLADLLIERGDVDRLRRVVRPDDVYTTRALAALLLPAGQYEEACVLLEPFYRQARQRWDQPVVDGPNSPDRARMMLAETSSLDRRAYPGATAAPEWVQWVVVAIGSGVLGNAAYQVLVESATRAWKRLRPQPQPSVDTPPTAPAVTTAPAHRSEREAFLLACVAVHDRCREVGAEVPDFDRVGYDAMNTGDGRWVFTIREDGGRKFTVRVPPPRAGNSDIVVAMYVTR